MSYGLRRLESVGMALLPPNLGSPTEALSGRRPVYFEDAGGFVSCDIYHRGGLAPGSTIDGPAVLDNPDSTVLIHPGWQSRIDNFGNSIFQPA